MRSAKQRAATAKWQAAGALKRKKPHGKLTIQNHQHNNKGEILVTKNKARVGHLFYVNYVEKNGQPAVLLNGLFIDPKFQRRGIATSILRRARKDFPDSLVNPGPRSNDGEALFQAISKNPEWAGSVIRTPQDIRSNLRGEYKLPRKSWKKAK